MGGWVGRAALHAIQAGSLQPRDASQTTHTHAPFSWYCDQGWKVMLIPPMSMSMSPPPPSIVPLGLRARVPGCEGRRPSEFCHTHPIFMM